MILLPVYRLCPLYVPSMFQSQGGGKRGRERWILFARLGLGGLVWAPRLQPISPGFRLVEHVAQKRVAAGTPTVIGQQVLLGNIGDIGRLGVLGQQMIEGLLPMRPQFGRNRLQPFISIGENRIDIEHHAPKRVNAVFDDVADVEAGGGASTWNGVFFHVSKIGPATASVKSRLGIPKERETDRALAARKRADQGAVSVLSADFLIHGSKPEIMVSAP